jgi:hypothetical protein
MPQLIPLYTTPYCTPDAYLANIPSAPLDTVPALLLLSAGCYLVQLVGLLQRLAHPAPEA